MPPAQPQPQPNPQQPQQPQQPQKAAPSPAQAPAAPPQQGGAKTIPGFNPKEFAQNLSMEASQVIPENIQEPDRKFIIEIIHRFCLLCGDALVKDEKYTFDAQQACMITQFIGEWTFHKSIDLINGGIAQDLREGVLNKVAYTVFEIAKTALSRNLPQEQVISVIELQVKTCFKQAIDDLKSKGKINDNVAANTMNQSNIDAMSQQEYEQEGSVGDDMSDAKILKLASLAMFVKKLPKASGDKIVSTLSKQESEVVMQYIKMPNLEQKIDTNITIRCLEEMKGILPEPKVVSPDRVYAKLFKIVKNNDKNEISNIIDNERPIIKQFVLSPYTKENAKIPPRVGNSICEYLERKLS